VKGLSKGSLVSKYSDWRWWRSSAPVGFLSVLFFLGSCPVARAQCVSLKSGDLLWVRLLDPLSSYSGKTGDKIRAMVIDSPRCEGVETITTGTLLEGQIQGVRRVGMGIVHQTAQLQVEFNRLKTKESEIAVGSRVLEIDNARETVKHGVIHGVNATNTPQGRITSGLRHLPTWNPYADLSLAAYRAAFPVFPEPEIYLPRGTDMRLQLTADLRVPEEERGTLQEGAVDEVDRAVLEITASELPERTTTEHGKAADIVNIALLGTREQMEAAFLAAGWRSSDPTTAKAVFHEFYAFLAFTNYAQAPISKQLMDGAEAAATWQKGLDSYQKREHLRLWARSDIIEGQVVWLGAMTRETGAGLSVRQHKFIHHIDKDLDEGREIVARDLSLAGCVEAVYYVRRPEAEHVAMNATGDPMRTDGSLQVLQLKDCENPLFFRTADEPHIAIRPSSWLARYARMLVMNFKTDMVRGNVLYGTFDLTRMMVRARRNHSEKAIMARRGDTKAEPHQSAEGDNVPVPTRAAFLDADY
jgi:hypothetical protein